MALSCSSTRTSDAQLAPAILDLLVDTLQNKNVYVFFYNNHIAIYNINLNM